jgi:hypothetical protein
MGTLLYHRGNDIMLSFPSLARIDTITPLHPDDYVPNSMFLPIDGHGLDYCDTPTVQCFGASMPSVFPLMLESDWYLSPVIYTVLDVHCPFFPPEVMVRLLSLFSLAAIGLVHATAARVKRQDITALSSTQIAGFAPFTHFASAAHCNSSSTRNWDCGGAFTHCSHPGPFKHALRRSLLERRLYS